MELKVYRSDSAVGGAGGGTRRRRGTEQPVHGTDGRRAGRARHCHGHLRLPLHDGAAQRSGSPAGARAGLARRDRCRRASELGGLPLFIGGKSMGGRISSQVAAQGVEGISRPGLPRLPAAPAGQARAAPRCAPAGDQRADAVRPGHARRVRNRRRDPRSCCRSCSARRCTKSPAAIIPSRCRAAVRRSRTWCWTRSWMSCSEWIDGSKRTEAQLPTSDSPTPETTLAEATLRSLAVDAGSFGSWKLEAGS